MARPLRIEYENAFYHVLNRGRGRQQIFHGARYYESFLQCLEEAQLRFAIEVHAYCLMGNNYHLLISTPRGNLSRAMRHINGLYTQRYNKLRMSSGPLFRGRYKAIVVDAGGYLLQLSRYIHRIPVDLRKPVVKKLTDYQWSSYRAYVTNTRTPEWLTRKVVYGKLGGSRPRATYRKYIDQGVDETTTRFYLSQRQASFLGDHTFREYACAEARSWDREVTLKGTAKPLTMRAIVSHVARQLGCTEQSIYKAKRGRGSPNVARWIAMKLCQDRSGHTLAQIGKLFGVGNDSTVSLSIARLKRLVKEDKKVKTQLNAISTDLTP